MIAKSYIAANLRELGTRYKRGSPKEALYFSKLAILELCGWIEESMDDMVVRCAREHLKQPQNLKFVEEQVIDRNYAFEYSKFRFMLIRLIGIVNVERIEKKIDAAIMAKFTSTLRTLKAARNTEAHTHIKGITKTINAPSITITQFQDVYAGLKEFERVIRSSKI